MNRLVLVTCAAIAAGAQAQSNPPVIWHKGQIPPESENWWGPSSNKNFSFPNATPLSSWTIQNLVGWTPTPKWVYATGMFGPTLRYDTLAVNSGWRLSATMSVEDSVVSPLNPGTHGNKGGAVLAVRIPPMLFDIWFSNSQGALFAQVATKVSGNYTVGPTIPLPPMVGSPWFHIDVIGSPGGEYATIFIDGQSSAALTKIPTVPLTYSDLGPTHGVSFGISSSYAFGRMSVADLEFTIRRELQATPEFAPRCLGGQAFLTVQGEIFGPATYQWYRDGAPIPGAVQSSYTATATWRFGTRYACQVTDAYGSRRSYDSVVYVCALDFDCDEMITLSDFFAFLGAWDAQAPNVDIDQNGVIDLSDFFLFLSKWDNQNC